MKQQRRTQLDFGGTSTSFVRSRDNGNGRYDDNSSLRNDYPDEPREVLDVIRDVREENQRLLRKVEDLQLSVIELSRERMRLKIQLDAQDVTRPDVGCVYIVKTPRGYKIGKTKALHSRIKQLQTGSPDKIEHVLSLVTDSMNELERELHQAFAGKRVHSEWFAMSQDDIEAIRNEYADYIVELD